MKPKQIAFRSAKDSDIPLNGKQLDLLVLVSDAGAEGCAVYGRGPTETIEALRVRGLVEPVDRVQVIVMGKLEQRSLWRLTNKGQGMLAS